MTLNASIANSAHFNCSEHSHARRGQTLGRTLGFARCRGQAATEVLTLAFVVIPLFVLIPYIARYQDINYATQLAARYTAFDAIIHNDTTPAGWKSKDEIDQEVRRRFFSEPGAAIKHNDAAGDFRAHQHPFWRDPQNGPLIKQFSDVSTGFGYATLSQTPEEGFALKRSGPTPDGDLFVLANQRSGEKSFKLKARGPYSAGVKVALAKLPGHLNFYKPFDTLDLSVTRSATVLIDHWAASGPKDVVERIEQSPEVYPAAQLGGVADLVGGLVEYIEAGQLSKPPQLGKLEDWKDVVPKDRLKGEAK